MKRTELIKNWVEIIAIICAGLWAFYVFVYSEYIKATRFFDATIDMESYTSSSSGLIPVQIKIKLINHSSRRLYIEAAYFEVHGDLIEADPNFMFSPEMYERALNDNAYTANGYKPSFSELIGGGGFLSNAWAEPKESLLVNRVIYVPNELYSQLECNIYVQSVTDPNVIDIQKTVNKDFSVDWRVKEAGKRDNPWIMTNDKTGYKLLNNNATLERSNAFLILNNTAHSKTISSNTKNRNNPGNQVSTFDTIQHTHSHAEGDDPLCQFGSHGAKLMERKHK